MWLNETKQNIHLTYGAVKYDDLVTFYELHSSTFYAQNVYNQLCLMCVMFTMNKHFYTSVEGLRLKEKPDILSKEDNMANTTNMRKFKY